MEQELLQDREKVLRLLHQILNSKRLLSDHLEILEEAYLDTENERLQTNYFTLTKTILLGTASVISSKFFNQYKYILPSISVSYLFLFGVKCFNQGRNKLFKEKIDKLINSLDDFDLCIKRNLIFFNETLYFKSNSEVMDAFGYKFVQNCLHTIILVSKALYNAMRGLEKSHPLPSKYNVLYQPLEDLDDCEYFNKSVYNFGVKDVKAFYNIYSYIQSQFLLRMGLSFLFSKKSIEFPILTKFINEQTNEDSKRLDFILSQINSQTEVRETLLKNSSSSINYLKSNSLYFTSKIVALAFEISHLDNFIQNINESDTSNGEKERLIKLGETLISIDNSLIICEEEFKRLSLNYQKFLNFKYEIPIPIEEQHNQIDNNLIEKQTDTKNISEKTLMPISDDFFALDGTEEEREFHNVYGSNNDLLNINSKITKSYFKPVLSQLKQKIGPIGETMKQKEREILAAKGIQFQDDELRNIHQSDGSDDDDDLDDNFVIKKKQKKNNKYDDNREFLVGKEQISLISCIKMPSSSMSQEDILE